MYRWYLCCSPPKPELKVADQEDQSCHQPVDSIIEQVEKLPHQTKVFPFLLKNSFGREFEGFSGSIEMSKEGGLGDLIVNLFVCVGVSDKHLEGDD